jgi:hypothetical protein
MAPRRMLWLATVLLLCSLQPAHSVEFTIDRNALKEIGPDERVLAYFVGPVYYLVDSRGNNIQSRFPQKPVYLSEHFKTTIFFFLAKTDAEQYRQGYERQLGDKATTKQTVISAILAQQYRTIGMPVEENPKMPDFVLFQSFPPKPVLVEFLVSKEDKSFYTTAVGSRKYIPAFFFQSDARKLQDRLNSQSDKKFDRIYVDFGTFLRDFMRPQARKDVPLVVFGENAEQLIPLFEKAFGGGS